MARGASKKNLTRADLAMGLRESAEKKFGSDNVNDWDQFYNSLIGVPLDDNLPLQYILGVDILPMGRCISVVGPWGSSKSSLCWYFAGLFIKYSGLVQFIDTEFKNNPNQIRGILESIVDPLPDNWFQRNKAKTIDTMMEYHKWFKNQIAGAGGMELGIPILLLTDSLGNVASERERENDEKGKTNGYSDAKNAAKIKKDMQMFAPDIENLPILCLLINHQKEVMVQEGAFNGKPSWAPPETTEAGGKHKDFVYTWVIQLSKGTKEKDVIDGKTPYFKIITKKNSLGKEAIRPIQVPYRSTMIAPQTDADIAEFGAEPREAIWYDWDHALALLLTDDKSIAPAKLAAIDFHIERHGATSKYYSSKTLGLTKVLGHEIGAAIHADAELVRRLQDNILHIRRKAKYGELMSGYTKPPRGGVLAGGQGGEDEAEGQDAE